MWVSRCYIGLPLAPGMVYQLATRWPLHLVKGHFHPWIFQKLPQKCNFKCYFCQGFHWLGPDCGSCGGPMWSSTVLTMRWFQAIDTSRFTCPRTQKRQFCAVDEGALPPATPVNPYLGGRRAKKRSIFETLSTFTTCLKLHFYTKSTFRWLPEAPKVPGGSNWAMGALHSHMYWKG